MSAGARGGAALERWAQVYRRAPGLFDAFSRAEDPDDRLWSRLAELAEIAGRRVLEVGSGTGRATRALAGEAAHLVAVEPLAAMARLCARDLPPRAVLLRARGEELPLRSSTLDAVVATWLVADLRPAARRAVLAEAERVLVPRGGIWLVENHWSGAFQGLRGREGERGRAELEPLLGEHGFELVEIVETELRFPSPGEAARVLGAILGEGVGDRLRRRPRARLGMNVAILHRRAP